MSYGDWVKEQREKQGLSLRELARKADISKTHVVNIENDSRVSLDMAFRVTKSLGHKLSTVIRKLEKEDDNPHAGGGR